ncbi:MAG: hypothetical protein PUC65_06260 [Clostridiales bacterium]|nr:hypothetical protein [Clostridiales bacterium]
MNYISKKKPDKLHTKSNLVGIIINWNQSNSTSKKMIYYDLAVELQHQLSQAGYDTILSTTKDVEKQADIISKRSLDAVYIIDISSSNSHQVTKMYYAPVIFIDCTIDDPLFCKIYPNYPIIFREARKLLQEEHPFLVMEDILNEELTQIIQFSFSPENIFVNSPDNNL